MAYFIFILSLLMDLKLRRATILYWKMHIIFLMRNCNITFEINFYLDIHVNIVQQTTQGFREEY